MMRRFIMVTVNASATIEEVESQLTERLPSDTSLLASQSIA